MKLQFKAGFGLNFFHDKPKDWHDGDIQERDEVFAENVLRLYPKNFSRVGGK